MIVTVIDRLYYCPSQSISLQSAGPLQEWCANTKDGPSVSAITHLQCLHVVSQDPDRPWHHTQYMVYWSLHSFPSLYPTFVLCPIIVSFWKLEHLQYGGRHYTSTCTELFAPWHNFSVFKTRLQLQEDKPRLAYPATFPSNIPQTTVAGSCWAIVLWHVMLCPDSPENHNHPSPISRKCMHCLATRDMGRLMIHRLYCTVLYKFCSPAS